MGKLFTRRCSILQFRWVVYFLKEILNDRTERSQNALLFCQLQVLTKRCDLNGTECENYDAFNLPDVCKLLNLQDQLWTDFMAHIQPKLRCPMNMKFMKVINATVDLGYISHLPLDGHNWIFIIKTFKSNAQHKKQLAFCILFEVTAMKTHRERSKKNPIIKPWKWINICIFLFQFYIEKNYKVHIERTQENYMQSILGNLQLLGFSKQIFFFNFTSIKLFRMGWICRVIWQFW